MKRVILNTRTFGRVSDPEGRPLPNATLKVPEKGTPYTVTGELHVGEHLYYFLMGFGIKTAYRADNFQDA